MTSAAAITVMTKMQCSATLALDARRSDIARANRGQSSRVLNDRCREHELPANDQATAPGSSVPCRWTPPGSTPSMASRSAARREPAVSRAGSGRQRIEAPGSGAVVAHLLWEQEVGGSSPPSPTPPVVRWCTTRGCSSMAEPQTSNLMTRVRFPSPALKGIPPGSPRGSARRMTAPITPVPFPSPDDEWTHPARRRRGRAHRGRASSAR